MRTLVRAGLANELTDSTGGEPIRGPMVHTESMGIRGRKEHGIKAGLDIHMMGISHESNPNDGILTSPFVHVVHSITPDTMIHSHSAIVHHIDCYRQIQLVPDTDQTRRCPRRIHAFFFASTHVFVEPRTCRF